MPQLKVVVTSTRPTRVGLPVAEWFVQKAAQHGKFEIALVDLKEIGLPLMDEPHHPMKRQYQHAHTKAWSELVGAADAFVFVTPEYNYGPSPALINALDYLYHEWNYKPAAFVSYGGVSGGLRAVQMTKLVLTTLKVMPIPEGVIIPFVSKLVNAEGKFDPGDAQDEPVKKVVDELARWNQALTGMRAG